MPRRRVLIDIDPLRRYPQFRRLWTGYLISTLGSQVTFVAVPYQVYRITHSTLDVGLVSLAQLVPLLLGSLGGGTIADRVDRRRLLIATQLLMASTSLGLALNARAPHPALWAIFVCSAAAAGLSGVDGPTRAAMMADYVDRQSLAQASALWQLLFSTSQVIGPAAAGLLIGHFGISVAYYTDVVTFGVSLVNVLRLVSINRAEPSEFSFGEVLGGLRYIRGHQVLQGVFLIDINAMVFGMPRALFPALAAIRFHGGPETVGLLYAAPAAGAFLGAASTGWVSSIRRQGRAVLIAVAVWGAAITAFGLSSMLALAAVFLMVAGGADIISAVFRGTMLQYEGPPQLRGRLQAVQTAVVTGGPRVGDFESGAVAAVVGAVDSVIIGGALCLVGVVALMRALPRFGRYTPVDGGPLLAAPGEDDVEG